MDEGMYGADGKKPGSGRRITQMAQSSQRRYIRKSAYILSEVTFKDSKLADKYRELAAKTIEQYGGRYIVRAGKREVLEGNWPQEVIIIIVEFPDKKTAKAWYASPEYAPALKIRQDALDRRLLLLEGVSHQNF